MFACLPYSEVTGGPKTKVNHPTQHFCRRRGPILHPPNPITDICGKSLKEFTPKTTPPSTLLTLTRPSEATLALFFEGDNLARTPLLAKKTGRRKKSAEPRRAAAKNRPVEAAFWTKKKEIKWSCRRVSRPLLISSARHCPTTPR